MSEQSRSKRRAHEAPAGGEELLTLIEAAQFLGISPRTLQRLLEQGSLRGSKVGRQWRFRRADLAAYLNRESVSVAPIPEADLEEALRKVTELAAEVTLVVTAPGDEAPGTEEERLVPEPVIRIATGLLQEAVHAGASDLHIEPRTGTLRIRLRLDGVLHEIAELPLSMHEAFIVCLKQMAQMSLAERRLPQDGRINVHYGEKEYDLRVCCLPTALGESIVMRILERSSVLVGLDRLGLFPDTMAQIDHLLNRPNGLFLITGSAGTGKTTTLYACLNRVNSPDRKIVTVEDPVEYLLPGVTQVAVNSRAGLTFPTALRALLRQDPDVLMAAEIRDLETAEILAQASLTGHLVLSVLHTNEAPMTIIRLLDIGVEPFLVAGTLIGALAQRLARRTCEKCKEEYASNGDELVPLGFIPSGGRLTLWRGRGCAHCRQTGYRGRIGIYELMTMNEDLAELAARCAPLSDIRNAARTAGMKTLQEDGLRKVLAGITTPEEVRRVLFV
jgi:type IV pilus assembly protein PilB